LIAVDTDVPTWIWVTMGALAGLVIALAGYVVVLLRRAKRRRRVRPPHHVHREAPPPPVPNVVPDVVPDVAPDVAPNVVRDAYEPALAPRPVAAPPAPVVAAYAPPTPPRAPAVPLQREDVKRMFVEWCRDERFPSDRGAEPARAHMRLVLADISSPDSEMRGFTDAKQVVEFERIGEAGAGDAWLVPNPDARFTPYVTRVFPSLRQGWASDGALYAGVTPRRITLGADGLWALAD
jgi:hypothetical protein